VVCFYWMIPETVPGQQDRSTSIARSSSAPNPHKISLCHESYSHLVITTTFGMPEVSSVDNAYVISVSSCCEFANEAPSRMNPYSTSRSSQRQTGIAAIASHGPLDVAVLCARIAAPMCYRGIALAGINIKEGPRKSNWLRTSEYVVSVAKPPCNLTALTSGVA